jgi:hypothetical protein
MKHFTSSYYTATPSSLGNPDIIVLPHKHQATHTGLLKLSPSHQRLIKKFEDFAQ